MGGFFLGGVEGSLVYYRCCCYCITNSLEYLCGGFWLLVCCMFCFWFLFLSCVFFVVVVFFRLF